ncbi:MAG: hypothetical protein ACKVX7_02915 [Planctomycetota bacterium]
MFKLRVPALAVAMLFGSVELLPGVHPDFQFLHCHFEFVHAGKTADTQVKLVATRAVQGFSFGLVHESAVAVLASIELGADIVNPDFFVVDIAPAGGPGGTVHCVIGTDPSDALPPGSSKLAVFHYQVLPSAPLGFSLLYFSSFLGAPAVPVRVQLAEPPGDVTPWALPSGLIVLPPLAGPPEFALNQLWCTNAGDDTVSIVRVADLSTMTFSALGIDPVAAALDANGVAWVVFQGSDNVVRFDANGMVIDNIEVGDGPTAIAMDTLGDAWVSCGAAGTLVKIASSGAILYGGDGNPATADGDGVLGPAIAVGSEVISLAVDRTNSVFAVVSGNETIEKRNSAGELLVAVSLGAGSAPFDIALDRAGFAWVTLRGFGRVQRRASDCTLAETFELPPLSIPTGIALRGANEAWVIGSASGELYRLRPGLAPETFSATPDPSGIAIDGEGYVWVADREQDTLSRFAPDGALALVVPVGSEPAFSGDIGGFALANALLPLGDLDVDGFPNALEVDVAANPFDATDVPPLQSDFVAPVEDLACDVTFQSLALSWTLPEPNPYESIVLRRDGVVEIVLPATATDYGAPEDLELGTYVFDVAGSAGGVESARRDCVVTIGQGQILATDSIEVADTVVSIFDVAARSNAPVGEPVYYLTDPGNDAIYGTDADFNVLVTLPSPFQGFAPTTGVAFDPEGDGGLGSLFVAAGPNGDPEQEATVREISLSGVPLGNPIVLQIATAAGAVGPLGLSYEPLRAGLAGLGLETGGRTIMALGPDTCELFAFKPPTMGVFGGGAVTYVNVLPAASAVHPQGGHGLNGVSFVALSTFDEDGGRVRVTSRNDAGQFEITELEIANGEAQVVNDPVPLASTVAENALGGFVVDADRLLVIGLSTNTIYELQSAFFLRGDATRDFQLDIADPIHILDACFSFVPFNSCIDAYDANDDGEVDISDAVLVLAFLFAQGTAPPAPLTIATPDPTPDGLPCL